VVLPVRVINVPEYSRPPLSGGVGVGAAPGRPGELAVVLVVVLVLVVGVAVVRFPEVL